MTLPSLVVRTPPTRVPERRWVLDIVLRERLGLEVLYEEGSDGTTTIRRRDAEAGEVVVPDRLLAMSDEAWLTAACLPTTPSREISELGPPWSSAGERLSTAGKRLDNPIPALDWSSDATGTVAWRTTPTGVELSADIIGGVFFLLSRLEELLRPERDLHGRFPAKASAAAVAGALRRPLADEYVDLLSTALRSVWPDLPLPTPSLRLRLTHDVDHAWAGYGLEARELPLTLVRDWRGPGPRMAASRARAWLLALSGRPIADPFDTYDFLMETSERHGLRSTFYLMAVDQRHKLDGRYRIDDDATRRLIRRIHDRGHEIGLHAGYESYRSPEALHIELAALVAAAQRVGVQQDAWPVRQHYLRFAYPETWRAQEAAGLTSDSSLGWAEAVGLRAGTTHPYRVFDVLERRPLNLVELPLAIMDATLFSYLHLSLADAALAAHDLIAACRPFGGEPVLLYHNSFPVGPRRRDHYRALIADLAAG